MYRQEKMTKFINEHLVDNAPDGSDLKVGDTVFWQNDFGVEFENKIIGYNYDGWYQEKYKKFVHLDTDSYWFPHDHLKLSKTKSHITKSLDLTLKNGLIAKNIGADNNCNLVFSIEVNENEQKAVLLDGVLYATSGDDWDEPISPLKDGFQPLEVQA